MWDRDLQATSISGDSSGEEEVKGNLLN